MTTPTPTLYSYDELNDQAQGKADDYYAENGFIEYVSDNDLFNAQGRLIYSETPVK